MKRLSEEDATPVTSRQTGSGPMAEAKRVFCRAYAAAARRMSHADLAARFEILALHYDCWTGPVLHDGKVLPARREDTERAADLVEYAGLVAEAQRLGVRG